MDFLHEAWILLKEWYWIPLAVLYLGVISTILIENRNPTKTIAWLLVIVFVPIIGLVIYYLFGQKFSKEKRLRQTNHRQTKLLERSFDLLEPKITESIDQLKVRVGHLARVFKYLKNEKLSLPSLRNNVQLLVNGEQKFKHFLESLRGAQESIHLEYYIFDTDELGMKVLDILEARARAGVVVRLIADAFGSPRLVRYMRRKKDSAIQFQAFLPITFTSLANSNYRNHRKIAVIDGTVGYVGGINISDKYINPNAGNLYWRDTAIRVEGEAVALLQINFWTSWNQTEGEPFDLDRTYIKRDQKVVGDAAVSFCTSDPGSIAPHNMEALLVGISEAQERIQLCTPYYVPSEELETALMIAVSSGIEVELMIPERGDSWIVQHASFSFIKSLLQRGVKVYAYTKGFLHAKTICIDRKLSYIGTMNLDIRSFDINYEIMAVVTDQRLCNEMVKQFEADTRDSDLITLEKWISRSRWKRGVDSLCRLLAPLL